MIFVSWLNRSLTFIPKLVTSVTETLLRKQEVFNFFLSRWKIYSFFITFSQKHLRKLKKMFSQRESHQHHFMTTSQESLAPRGVARNLSKRGFSKILHEKNLGWIFWIFLKNPSKWTKFYHLGRGRGSLATHLLTPERSWSN